MNTAHTEILAAINTNDLRAIETVLNRLGIEADVLDRNTDRERLMVAGLGVIRWDAQDLQNEGWVLHSLDSNGGVEYDAYPVDNDSLANQLAEIVGYAQQVAQ